MTQITYEPRDDEDRLRGTTVFGITFAAGVAVEVDPDSPAAMKLARHPEFVVTGHKSGGVHPNAPAADPSPDSSAVIPDDWASIHWKRQAAIASKISGRDVANGSDAVEIILSEIDRRDVEAGT